MEKDEKQEALDSVINNIMNAKTIEEKRKIYQTVVSFIFNSIRKLKKYEKSDKTVTETINNLKWIRKQLASKKKELGL